MRRSLPLALALAASAAAGEDGGGGGAAYPLLQWAPPEISFFAGHVDDGAGGATRSFMHAVFKVGPRDVLSPNITGFALLRLDDGPWIPAPPLMFERHLTRDPDGTGYQMWNAYYQALRPPTVRAGSGGALTVNPLPREICVKVRMVDLSTGESNRLDPACAPFATHSLRARADAPMRAEISSQYSAATALCSKELQLCRVNVHLVVWSTASADPLDPVRAGAAFSFDGGPWHEGVAMYEQHFDPRPAPSTAAALGTADGGGGGGGEMGAAVAERVGVQPLSHAMQADWDEVLPYRSAANRLPSRVCYRVRFEDARDLSTASLDGCMAVCHSLHEFATPYCPELHGG